MRQSEKDYENLESASERAVYTHRLLLQDILLDILSKEGVKYTITLEDEIWGILKGVNVPRDTPDRNHVELLRGLTPLMKRIKSGANLDPEDILKKNNW